MTDTVGARERPFPQGFLAERETRTWRIAIGEGRTIVPHSLAFGRGANALEVALAVSRPRPAADDVRRLWRERQGGRPSPLLLVVGYEAAEGTRLALCGPAGDSPPLLWDLAVGHVERLVDAALDEPTRHAALRFLLTMMPEVASDLPGVRNAGLVATQELVNGVPARPDWIDACVRAASMLALRGRALVERLGFAIEPLGTASSVLRVRGNKRAVAVFLDEGEAFEEPGARFGGTTPVSRALALAEQEGLPWVVLTRARQLRLYSARAGTGVGHKGRADTYVEVDLALLPGDRAGYLTLLFGADALTDDGTMAEILVRSADFAAGLGVRLRERIYGEVVPAMATAIARRTPSGPGGDEQRLGLAYEQTLVVLFRTLFVAYAEDKDLLPYRTNGLYGDRSLKRLARRLAEPSSRASVFDPESTDLWDHVHALWRAVDKGNARWGVPAYDGGLFSDDEIVHPVGAIASRLSLSDAEFGPPLQALLVAEGADGVTGPVDFRSLSVREFGTIYEGLLESGLSEAPSDLSVNVRGDYVPADPRTDASAAIRQGEIYFHNRSGARKATGSYFTKPFAVEHLLDHALEPVLDEHVRRVADLFASGDDAGAAEAFFDFRCADLAMGSGHFLVAAVDRIEARLSNYLALHPIPAVLAELDALRSAALQSLGDLGEGVEIEATTLLRRQVARRCVYGVDRNPMAVELARLAIWIHTFVPGLPLSFLDHNLVCGDSLTGIGTVDEAAGVLDKAGQTTLSRGQIRSFLERSDEALRRLAHTAEATTAEIGIARAAHAQALAAVEPARKLFDALVAARLGKASLPLVLNDGTLAAMPDLDQARSLASGLKALHFPVAFPEVVLRGRPGFDCILGNPPWEEATVEELGFWALRFPGLKSMNAAQKKAEVARLRAERPDLVAEYDRAVAEAADMRRTLLAGPYPGMGTGDPDLYKAFAWRFWQLVRTGGAIGVVLPRSSLSAKGSTPWREAVLTGGAFEDVTTLLNTGGWVFDDAEPRYTVGLVAIRKGVERAGPVHLRGPFATRGAFERGVSEPAAVVQAADLRSWSEAAALPLLPTAKSGEVFAKLRRHPRMDAAQGWRVRPATEFHATNDKNLFVLDEAEARTDMWPVYQGASFNLWRPDTGTYYAWAEPERIQAVLREKRKRRGHGASRPLASPATGTFSLPCLRPRIAFRDVARATDTRTVIAALVPPNVVITNQAPYLEWEMGDECDAAYLLGVLCSIPLDWHARRVVELHLNFHVFNAMPVPRPDRRNSLRRRVEEIAGRLAAVDDRYANWARAVGVPVGSVTPDAEAGLLAELDAAVALLYGLDEGDVRHIFETFHVGWAYEPRLTGVLEHMHRLGRAWS